MGPVELADMCNDIRTNPKHNGFTIIEAAIIIALIGAFSYVLMLAWPNTTISVKARAQQVQADIRYAQNLAMTKNERHRVTFIDNRHYQIEDSNGNVVNYRTGGSSSFSLPSNIQFNPVPSSPIIFNNQGRPYIGSSTPLSSSYTITLESDNNKTANVTVIPETGSTSVSPQ